MLESRTVITIRQRKNVKSKVRTHLLIGVACLNPVDSFSNFDINKILRMAGLYPNDFGENIMVTLKNQLETYIVDVRDVDERFSNLKGLCDLSEELVKTKKYFNYPLVFPLVKFALLLSVAIAKVEIDFPAMKLIKSELRNRMDDGFMSNCTRVNGDPKQNMWIIKSEGLVVAESINYLK
ncbi:uncharacterized protein LOC124897703 [Capsicum annuum]|uniref:uncharacterized protein LOC124897703 n=1 Tax=Capsicum annuum TaxID=4072 RepID=UPI001FB04E60|nr:uncharacterized protein LOC124897703 [Capsicum annuum]